MYIWQWQDTFINAVKNLLQGIFNTLELSIVSNTFAIAIPTDSQNSDRVIFHPQNCRFTPDHFKQVFVLAKHNFDSDPEQFFFMGAAHQNKIHRESLYPKALQQAVRSILQHYDNQRKQTSFCSFPIQKNNYWVITVIQLTSADFDRQYRLTKKEHEVPSMRKRRIDRCFLEAIIYRVLKESELELQKPTEGNIAFLANSERVIEDAASSLLDSIEVHINKFNKIDLLSFANAIAAERYEGAASEGRLIICHTNHPDIFAKIKLNNPIDIYNYRGIRKLLEVSSNQMALLCDVESVWGLGIPLDTYNPSLENLFEIRFLEHHTWELVHAENIMLRVMYMQARLPRSRFDRELFCDRVHQLFEVDRAPAKRLIMAVEAAVKQRHGTMLVVAPEAEQETIRLAAQSTVIEPVIITKEIISHVSCVDGAILISPDGMIYSLGVI
ncbi:MAG: hypothetical protein ACFCAD_03955, partial [Pleurocapsa sp.]